ncbi:LPS assembly lipoprotein LptE [Desulfovibrio sp. OttesenSCG-928-I05]|nr:LPS assembly lipoprotein LptE [Desulfovibrio sp. OttesenSCG-928-I05]
MSLLPENSSRAACSLSARKGGVRALFLVFLLALALGGLEGCGYTLGSESPSIFSERTGGRIPTLKLKSVDNPTLFTWLPYTLRSNVRDEIAARNLATWVDSGRADFELDLKISSYTYRSSVYDENDATQLYSANLTVEAIVYEGGTNQVIWRSGGVNYSDSRETLEEKGTADYLVQNIARQLADRMRNAF